VASGEVTEVPLEFPPDQAGFGPSIGAFWVDDTTLAVPTADITRWLPDRLGPLAASRPVASVSHFDPSGRLLRELPVNTDDLEVGADPHAGLIWIPVGMVRDDRYLLVRRPGPDQLEFAAPDLAGDPGPYQGVAFTLPGAVTDEFLPGWPHAWLADGRLLVRPNLPIGTPVRELSMVDLASGEVRTVDMAGELAASLPIPGGAMSLTFADAQVLPPAAAHLAF